jgi:hypothetical protein
MNTIRGLEGPENPSCVDFLQEINSQCFDRQQTSWLVVTSSHLNFRDIRKGVRVGEKALSEDSSVPNNEIDIRSTSQAQPHGERDSFCISWQPSIKNVVNVSFAQTI